MQRKWQFLIPSLKPLEKSILGLSARGNEMRYYTYHRPNGVEIFMVDLRVRRWDENFI